MTEPFQTVHQQDVAAGKPPSEKPSIKGFADGGSSQNPVDVSRKQLKDSAAQLVPASLPKLGIDNKIKTPDGNTLEYDQQGQLKAIVNDKVRSALIFKNGMVHEIYYPYPFRTGYIFDRDNPNDPKEITSITGRSPQGLAKYEKIAGQKDLWRNGNEILHRQIAVNEKEFVITDLTDANSPIKTTHTLDGVEVVEYAKTGDIKATKNGFVTRIKHDGNEVRFALAKQDKKICAGLLDGTYVKEIEDTRRNWHLTKQADDSWKVEALNAQEPFVPPAEKFKGDAEVNGLGDYALAREDRIRTRFNQNGTIDQNLGDKEELCRRIDKSIALCDPQKKDIKEKYLPEIEKRQFLIAHHKGNPVYLNPDERQKEITNTLYQLTRFLDPPEKNGYPPSNLAKMLEQSAFHIANPSALRQYGNVCNVDDVGGCLLHSDPSVFVRVIASVGLTGAFRRADDHEITPLRAAIEAAFKGDTLPLDPLNHHEDAVTRMWQMAAVNSVMINRGTKLSGESVEQGSLLYAQWNARFPGDRPAEAMYHFKDGKSYVLRDSNNEIINSPAITDVDTMMVYQQITGKAQEGRFLISKEQFAQAEALYKNWEYWPEYKRCFAVVNSKEETFERLQNGTSPIIARVDGDYIYGNRVVAGWHVLMLTEHTPAYLDVEQKILDSARTQVFYDDTNSSQFDHIKSAVSLDYIYGALTESAPAPRPQ